MWRWRKRLIERNERMGPVGIVAINIGTWLIGYVVVVSVHRLLFQMHVVHSTSEFTWDDVVVAVLTGSIIGAFEWSDGEKKRELEARNRQGTDATMI